MSMPHHPAFDKLVEDIQGETPHDSILKLLDHPAIQ